MGWFLALLVALLSGGLGLLAAGFVMSLCVRWYHVSSFEGKAGYAIVAMAVLGGFAGFALGLVVALTVPEGAALPFLRALGVSAAALLGLAGGALVVARVLADIPPTLDGEEIVLDVEIRLPVDRAALPSCPPESAYVELGALRGRVRRKAKRGALRLSDARREDDRWIVPASAPVFTRRGKRLLTVHVGDEPVYGFLVPLPSRPGRRHLSWSDWGPRPRPPNPPWPDTQASFRFRVQPESAGVVPEAVP